MKTKRYNRHILSVAMRCVICTGVLSVVTACADDVPSPAVDGGKTIRFEVTSTGDWNTSRGGNTVAGSSSGQERLNVITLKSVTDNLYLIPEVTDGISAVKDSNSDISRATGVSTSTISDFGVFASMNSGNSSAARTPDYMYNVDVTRSNNWTPEAEYLWPGSGTLHINAYSPYCDLSGSVPEEGVISLPSPDATGELSLTYVTPAEATAQTDLLWATPRDASSSPCAMTFNHALTAVRFTTGQVMTPCTIKKIEITGVNTHGSLNLETGVWSDLSVAADFAVEPEIELTAATGSTSVSPDTPMTSDEQTFLFIPQELPADATLTLTIDIDGKATTYTSSLAGQKWTAGKTVTYRLSVNPSASSFEVDGVFETNYTGGKVNFTVTSHGSDSASPLKWTAEFIDDAGNVIPRPNWITDFPEAGSGDSACVAATQLQDFEWLAMSEGTRTLQNAADINASSGNNPYNLSNSTGASSVENTANSYIINAPGTYSLPLVYGNAVKNGVANTAAYISTSHNRTALKTFINHLGNDITDPYIYNNSGCDPDKAILVWESQLNLVRNVALSEDKRSVIFDIPHTSIRQGNALVALLDKDSTVMWSWQLWVTDYVSGTNLNDVPGSGTATYSFMPRNIGEINGGDETDFKECSVKIRFTQESVDGSEPATQIITFNQSGKKVLTPTNSSFYQWGRKDPKMAAIDQWYRADHTEVTALATSQVTGTTTGNDILVTFIRTPDVFWCMTATPSFSYTNLWNCNLSQTAPVKTVYDPSPVGYRVPDRNETRACSTLKPVRYVAGTGVTQPPCYYLPLPDGSEMLFHGLGYRGNKDGEIGSGMSLCWDSFASATSGGRFVLYRTGTSGNITDEENAFDRLAGFGVRPVRE